MDIITVVELNGSRHCVRASLQITVSELKQEIYHLVGLPSIAQKLVVNNIVLDNDAQRLIDVVPALPVREIVDDPVTDDKRTTRRRSRSRSRSNVAEEEESAGVLVTLVQLCSKEEAFILLGLQEGGLQRPSMSLDPFEHDAHLFIRDMLNIHGSLETLHQKLMESGRTLARCFAGIPESCFSSENFVWLALQITSLPFKQVRPLFIYLARSHLLSSREIVELALQHEPSHTVIIEPKLLEDRELSLLALQHAGRILKFVDEATIRKDKELVLTAVKANGNALEFALEWNADIDVVRAAVEQKGEAFMYVHPTLQADRNLVMSAVEQNGRVLQYASAALQADREVVLVAVGQNGLALEFADVALKRDREIVTNALTSNGTALRFAAWEFRGDRDTVVLALRHSAYALEHAIPELQADQEMRMIAVRLALERHYGTDAKDLLTDKDAVIRGIQANGLECLHLGPALRCELLRDEAIALALVQHEPTAYRNLQAPMRESLGIAKVAVERDWRLMADVPYTLRNNLELQVAAVTQSKHALKFLVPTDRKRALDMVYSGAEN